MATFHPDLRIGRFIPPFHFGPRSVSLLRGLPRRRHRPPDDLVVTDVSVPGPGRARLPVRLYRPPAPTGPRPALLWVHGGGMVMGDHLQDERPNAAFARSLGITVASVDYRLAPAYRAPAAVQDVHATFSWLTAHAGELDVEPARIAIGGASAGGGIAAAAAQLAQDLGGPTPAFQLLVYPMLDDRTVLREDQDTRGVRVWSPRSNEFGWASYLGVPPGSPDVPALASPARREDLAGLPPAWIGVGSLDLFHDEDVRYAQRLRAAGVPCALVVVEGAFHGFDALFPRREVSRRFWRAQAQALRGALLPSAEPTSQDVGD